MDGNSLPRFTPGMDQMNQAAGTSNMMSDPSAYPVDPNVMNGLLMQNDPSQMVPLMMQNGNGHVPVPTNTISSDDIALYDRQIRLWGMDAQAKIQSANLLLITMRGLATEIAKNLVLAGIGSLTLLDASPVTEADLGSGFFFPEESVGQSRAEAARDAVGKLNPRVHVRVDAGSAKSKGPSYFASFDLVIATDLDPESYKLINTATRLNGKPFYAAGVHGMYGYIFSDLIEHDYVIERQVGNIASKPQQETTTRSIIDVQVKQEGPKNIEVVKKRELYSTWFLASDIAILPPEYRQSKRRLRSVSPALSCLRALWDFMQLQNGRLPSNRDDLKTFTQIATQKHKALSLPSETLDSEFLRKFLQGLGSEIAPVNAILGGQLAQDVINVLGHKQQPIQNMVIFDGNSMESLTFPLHPEGELGSGQLSFLSAGNVTNGGPMAMGTMMPPGQQPALDGGMNQMQLNGAQNVTAQQIPAQDQQQQQQPPPPTLPQSQSTSQPPPQVQQEDTSKSTDTQPQQAQPPSQSQPQQQSRQEDSSETTETRANP